MNRRSFLKLASAALVPTWLPRAEHPIDLSPFCTAEHYRYDLSTPFTQLAADFPYRYATDTRICVRVPENERLNDIPDTHRPPVQCIKWDHSEGGGWKDWPAKCHLLAASTPCPTCDGDGFVVRSGEAVTCLRCHGKGEGVFPGLQRIGSHHIEAEYDAIIRRHLGDCEYRFKQHLPPGSKEYVGMIQFRSRGGDGVLTTVYEDSAQQRLRKAVGV